MSIDLMSRAWRANLPQGSDKLILLALADFANDSSGEAWPSNETIGHKCSRSEQTVREALRRLAAAGHITRVDRPGRTSMFLVHPTDETPPNIHEGSEDHKGCEDSYPHPSQYPGGDPSQYSALPLPISRPEPSRTIIEPSVEPPSRARATEHVLPDWMPADAWQAFIDMRRGKKKPPTAYATGQLIAKLGVLMAKGHDPRIVLDQSTMNSWTDLYPLKDTNNGNQSRATGHETGDGVPFANPMLRAIAGRRQARGE